VSAAPPASFVTPAGRQRISGTARQIVTAFREMRAGVRSDSAAERAAASRPTRWNFRYSRDSSCSVALALLDRTPCRNRRFHVDNIRG
jgi:hypothetical protein